MKSADFILPHEGPIKRSLPFVLVCEGFGDVCFVAELLKIDNIITANVGCPTQKYFGDGKDAIPAYLQGVAVNTKGLRGVLVVADADDDPRKSFTAMQTAFAKANFPVPSKPFAIEESELRVAVFLVPGENKTGTLDHLLLEALFQKAPKAKDCVEAFVECTEASKTWKPNEQAKMKLSSLVSAYCQENPWCSLAWLWSQNSNPIPIGSDCFQYLRGFLKQFCA